MKYYARKGNGLFSGVGLYSQGGKKLALPEGYKVIFKSLGQNIYFQLSDGVNETPLLSCIDANGDTWTASLVAGGCFDMNPKTLTFSPIYSKKLDDMGVHSDGTISFVQKDGNWIPSGFVLDKERVGQNVQDSYLFGSFIGVRDVDDKCAIFDTFSRQVITPFEYESGAYEIVAAFNNDTRNVDYKTMFVVESIKTDISKILGNKGTKTYQIFTEDGEKVEEFEGTGFLWSLSRKEKLESGEQRDYVYSAFSKIREDGSHSTVVLKIDAKDESVVYKTEIPGIAEKGIQEKTGLIFLKNNDLVLYTKENDQKGAKLGASIIYGDGKANVVRKHENDSIALARNPRTKKRIEHTDGSLVFLTSAKEGEKEFFGAFRLTPERVVELLFRNKWTSLKVFEDKQNGVYIEYINPKKFGKYSLEERGGSYESTPSQFVSLTSGAFARRKESGLVKPKFMTGAADKPAPKASTKAEEVPAVEDMMD